MNEQRGTEGFKTKKRAFLRGISASKGNPRGLRHRASLSVSLTARGELDAPRASLGW